MVDDDFRELTEQEERDMCDRLSGIEPGAHVAFVWIMIFAGVFVLLLIYYK